MILQNTGILVTHRTVTFTVVPDFGMSSDWESHLTLGFQKLVLTDEEIKNLALAEVEKILRRRGMSLRDYVFLLLENRDASQLTNVSRRRCPDIPFRKHLSSFSDKLHIPFNFKNRNKPFPF
ncbi:ATP-dependent DNA helicase PIF1 [Striga asiatica]|uniref:ATP-dependent DNA helicase PIF1 n=1 Tax=Striga asiatica TaxID=4170 RepID=A0A5A7QF02_STRAF|nr:ATP-dependent DNA helicase PIF1 [Striga asiatica]